MIMFISLIPEDCVALYVNNFRRGNMGMHKQRQLFQSTCFWFEVHFGCKTSNAGVDGVGDDKQKRYNESAYCSGSVHLAGKV